MKKRACQFLSIVVLIAAVSCFPVENAFATSGDVWYKVFTRSYYKFYGDMDVLAMAEFGGTVYAGVARTGVNDATPSASIYRLEHEGCKLWDHFTPPWKWGTGGYAMAMQVFKDMLYVGTDLNQVWRTDGVQWKNWQDVTGNWGTSGCIEDMAVFNALGKDYLYAITSSGIWRTSDGFWWDKSVTLSDPKIFDVLSLEVFNGYLYAGAGLTFYVGDRHLHGIQLWRTKDGVNWTKFKEELQPPDWYTGFPEHLHALKAFKGYLYVGAYHGNWLYRTDGTSSWDYIDTNNVVQGSGVYRLEEHNKTLYLGMNDWDTPGGSDLLYSSTDGITWSTVTGSPVENSNTAAVGSLLSFGEKLYVGLKGRPQDNAGTMEIWALGPSAPDCAFKVTRNKVVGTVVPRIEEIVDIVREFSPHLPDLRVLPWPGPRPPPPDGLPYEWEFTLVRNMMDAIDRIDVPPELEGPKEQVLSDLYLVDSEVGQAMLIISEATSAIRVGALEIPDVTGLADEVLGHLYNALEYCEKALHDLSLIYQEPVSVRVDIKPGSCPNPLNIESKGILPVAVLGTENLDVKTIDPGTIKLTRDPVSCDAEPIRWSYQDCNGDRSMDLTLKFDTQELVSCLALESIVAGEKIPLTLTGNFKKAYGGAPIEGQDFILVLKSGT